MSSSYSTSSFSSEEDSDSDGDLKPITDYLSNRREAARQLFRSVKIEKVRLMLPQVLKKMELSELEEWCANELAGMSKPRILSILHGTPMSGSSATSESDDSGPSLEIISDTEEWLSDDEPTVKQEPLSPSSKSRRLKSKHKGKPSDKSKSRKGKVGKGSRAAPELEMVKVKKEKDKNEPKPQEGESLLDLLELEMRARAIRALIRKEEDIIPDADKLTSTANALKSTLDSVSSTKTKLGETAETLVEKIGEDEDVVLLVKPTPTIELISSDSDNECPAERVNKKLENERIDESTASGSERITAEAENPKSPANPVTAEPNITQPENSSTEIERQTFRKLKRRPQLRTKSKSLSDCCDTTGVTSEVGSVEEKSETHGTKSEIEDKSETGGKKVDEKIEKTDKTSEDNEEIIDLDDYPDDMYNIEPDDTLPAERSAPKPEKTEGREDSQESENWATRYYQTDSVQSVIKESKIQSEIRKRLRERQRLSKLNNSPKEPPSNDDNENIKLKPTGSVDEYLALKGMANSNSSLVVASEIENRDGANELSLPVSKEEVNVSISSPSTLPQNLSSGVTDKLTVTTAAEVNKL